MRIIALFSLLLFPVLGLCKSAGSITGSGHSGDMVRVLGIDMSDKDAKKRARKLAEGFAAFIDSDSNILYRKIKNVAPRFSWHSYGHRLFFHWGLNGDPKNIFALEECVKEATIGQPNLEQSIWNLIIEEQSRRNRAMFSVVKDSYHNIKGDGRPAPFRHDDIRGIASIVYDTHIIGDYIDGTEKTKKALIDLPSVKADIVNAVSGIAARDADFKDNKLLNQFRRDIKNIVVGSDSEQASAILSVMISQIPVILEKCPRVGKTLKVKVD